MSDELFKKLKKIISSQLGVEEADINLNSHLQDDLNADPLSIADLIIRIEEEFGIKIPQGQISNFFTVGDLLNFIADQTGEI